MAHNDVNLAERPGSLVEAHKNYDPRIVFFYFVIAALLLTLAIGLGYQQLHLTSEHEERARRQTQRRILIPGPRGTIYDRNGNVLVTNRPVWTVVLHLEELNKEFVKESDRIRKNYDELMRKEKLSPKDVPDRAERRQIACVTVAQRYLDQVSQILKRPLLVDSKELKNHFKKELLLPFTLVDDLNDDDYAKLIERLPVNSPLQVYASSIRSYPYKSVAAHTLGYVRIDAEVEAVGFPGEGLKTFPMKDTIGVLGLEKKFNSDLNGIPGGAIYRVNPSGYKISKPLEQRKPQKGSDIITSLDIDLQRVAEDKIAETENEGSAVALDVNTGEVLVLATQPTYDSNLFIPRISHEEYQKIQDQQALFFRAMNGHYPPGSTFKILVSIAGLRSGKLDPNDTSVDCTGAIYLGRTRKTCDNGHGLHGHADLAQAIGMSCDVYFYRHGIDIGPRVIAAEARRFHLDRPTGIELPFENPRSLIPDPDWKRQEGRGVWTDGDTANMAIGQGDVQVSPLQMACFAASIARNETYTEPKLLHDPNRPPQHTEPIGLTPEQRAVLIQGMKNVVTMPRGTAYQYLNLPSERIPGVTIAGKTGTAEVGAKGDFNVAWFIAFAPVEKPEIAVAVAIRSNESGEYGGGRNAGPVANAILKAYFAKKANPTNALLSPVKVK